MSAGEPCMFQVQVPSLTQHVPAVLPARRHRDDECSSAPAFRDDECSSAPVLKLPRRSEPHGFIPKIIPYGTFYIIGYNGFKPPFNRGRVKSYCQLIRKYYGDGVKYMTTRVAKNPEVLKAALAPKSYNVFYKFSVSETVIGQYARDSETDLFQIGRSAEPPIDFVVMDVDRRTGRASSTVSRYACRVLADRKNCKDVHLYAAGFNEACNIFLGEKAIKWHEKESVDGLTTNGVLLNHPQGDFWGGEAKPGMWREVSVNGRLFSLRPIRDSDVRGTPVQNETNLLRDGSLIDLCGATLIWRSADGLKKSITKEEIKEAVASETLFSCTGRCEKSEVQDSCTLLSSGGSSACSSDFQTKCRPRVYLQCGHVESCCDTLTKYVACPVCLTSSPTATLKLGLEAAFYVSRGPLHYAFRPCGHIANEKTVKYWSSVNLPNRKSCFEAKCPFCEVPLDKPVGYVHLKRMT